MSVVSSEYKDTDKVIACLDDLQAAVQSVAEFEKRTLMVFDEDDAIEGLKTLKRFPAAVIQYEGMRSQGDAGSTAKTGGSCMLVASIMVINQGEQLVKTDTKIPALLLLTQLRRKLLNRTSPSGHKWAFVVEAAASVKGGHTFWIQRWTCPLMLQVGG